MRHITHINLIALLAVTALLPRDTFAARKLSQEENESLCERYGDSLERKFVTSPQLLVNELDELIVRVGTLGPDRVNHDKSGRMLASIAGPSKESEHRRKEAAGELSALDVRVHNKLTEANKVLTQSKRLGFFDEDEERQRGVQEACAKVIFERASILEKMTKKD